MTSHYVHGIEIKAALQGVIGNWFASNGSGTVHVDGGGAYLVTRDSLAGAGVDKLKVGQRVEFEVGADGETVSITRVIFTPGGNV
jgi:cold shock CspA family protein